MSFLNFPNVTNSSLNDILSFIYNGVVGVGDIVPLLNAGESLEIQGLQGSDCLESERPNTDNPKSYNIFAGAKSVPADHELKKSDIRASKIATNKASEMVKSMRTSTASKSGSEYEPEFDSDDQIREKPVIQRRTLRNAKVTPKVPQPQKKVNAPKQSNAVPIPKSKAKKNKTRKSSGQSRKRASWVEGDQNKVPNVDDVNERDEEETVTMTKKQFDQMLRALNLLSSGGKFTKEQSDVDESSQDEFDDYAEQPMAFGMHDDRNNNDDDKLYASENEEFDESMGGGIVDYEYDGDYTQSNEWNDESGDGVGEVAIEEEQESYGDLGEDEQMLEPQAAVQPQKNRRQKRTDAGRRPQIL